MKKLLLVLLILSVVPVFGAHAQTIDNLTRLAEIYPADTIGFGAFRTDTAQLDAFDMIGRSVAAHFGEDPEDYSLRNEIDDELQDEYGEGVTYDSFIDPWLGDRGAVGFFLDEPFLVALSAGEADIDDTPFVWSVEIDSREGALSFVEGVLVAEEYDYTVEEMDGYTLLTIDDPEYAVVVQDAVRMGGYIVQTTRLAEGDFDGTLSSEPTFVETMLLLPAGEYNLIAYTNLSDAFALLGQAEDPELNQLAAFADAVGGVAGGSAYLGNNAYTVDIVQQGFDLSLLGGGLSLSQPDLGAIDATFANNIAGNAPVVLQMTNLRGLYEAILANIEAAAELEGSEDNIEDAKQGIRDAEAFVMETTGLSLQNDIIGWLTGDAALYLNFSKAAEAYSNIFALLSDLPIDFALLLEVEDADAFASANRVVDAIETTLIDLAPTFEGEVNLSMGREEIGGANAVVVTIIDATGTVPFPIELIFGATDSVFAVGTRNSATSAFNGDGNLTANPAYAAASEVFLLAQEQIWYVGFPDLLALVQLANAAQDEQTSVLVRQALTLFDSATVTSDTDGNGDSFVRFTLTFADGVLTN